MSIAEHDLLDTWIEKEKGAIVPKPSLLYLWITEHDLLDII